ncbi:MAG: ABC transporter substrate-binding protein [Alphaproteobacteria bacterium]|nr:ABC transporter substrate-binding protein [Alphaproteobacteria bacterium]
MTRYLASRLLQPLALLLILPAATYGLLGLMPGIPADLILGADPREYRNRTAHQTDTGNPGSYNGPYVVDSVEVGASLTLERNPYWKGTTPAFDRIVVRAVDRPAIMDKLFSGQQPVVKPLDWVHTEAGVENYPFDPALRGPMWAELQRIYATDLPALPLYFWADSYILPKWLSGLTPTGHKYASTNWIKTWRVVK